MRLYKGKQAKKTDENKVALLKHLIKSNQYNVTEKVTFMLLEINRVLDNESYQNRKD